MDRSIVCAQGLQLHGFGDGALDVRSGAGTWLWRVIPLADESFGSGMARDEYKVSSWSTTLSSSRVIAGYIHVSSLAPKLDRCLGSTSRIEYTVRSLPVREMNVQ